MVDNVSGHTSIANEDAAHEVLLELERQCGGQYENRRKHPRIALKMKVILQPGNSSELMDLKLQGVTGEISDGGFRAMFPLPLGAGDVYRLRFDPKQIDLPLVFGRCLRCRMAEEDTYDVGFKFFTEINTAEAIIHQTSELLI
ncbi:MAG: PilZ domain-containing protein [Phycisphaerae bacterium]|jgi:hypothetical protein|nr:PilZ domain-containing protein [Phycisphaerae bacterium]